MATTIKAYVNHLGPVIELPTIAAMRTTQASGQRIRSFRRTKGMGFFDTRIARTSSRNTRAGDELYHHPIPRMIRGRGAGSISLSCSERSSASLGLPVSTMIPSPNADERRTVESAPTIIHRVGD